MSGKKNNSLFWRKGKKSDYNGYKGLKSERGLIEVIYIYNTIEQNVNYQTSSLTLNKYMCGIITEASSSNFQVV